MKGNVQETGKNKINIDYLDIKAGEASLKDFPIKIEGEYRIHFTQEAYDEMKKHAATTNNVELGGVLIGDIYKDAQGFYLEIVAAVPGEKTNNYGTQVTFTHDTWDYINKVKDEKYPSLKIVGWYHTHPGFGVFLSNMDMFIQENFFNQPYQIAVVLETVQKQEGCFIWKGGKCKNLRRYWSGNREIALVSGDADVFQPDQVKEAVARPVAAGGHNRPSHFTTLTNVLFVFMVLILGFMFGRQYFVNDVNELLYQSLQNEMYGLLSTNSLRTLATNDLEDVGKTVNEMENQIKSNNKQKALDTMAKLKSAIENMRKSYQIDKEENRRNLIDLANTKQTMDDRVRDGLARGKDLEKLVKDHLCGFYVMRITDLLVGAEKIGKINYNDKEQIQYCLNQIGQIAPDKLKILREKQPALDELFSASEAGAENGTRKNSSSSTTTQKSPPKMVVQTPEPSNPPTPKEPESTVVVPSPAPAVK